MTGASELTTVSKAQLLSDIELAALLCLVTSQHCLIDTSDEVIDDVAREIGLACEHVFGLAHAVLSCTPATTVEAFGDGLLVELEGDRSWRRRKFSIRETRLPRFESVKGKGKEGEGGAKTFIPLETRGIANVVVVKNLDVADDDVQTQALELIRGRRIFTRKSVYAVPKEFILIVLNSSDSQKRLKVHLIDHLLLCHHHYDEDALPNLEDQAEREAARRISSTASTSTRPPSRSSRAYRKSTLFMTEELDLLAKNMANVQITAEIRAYMHHIVVFLRQHRAVAGGVTALATRQMPVLSKALAVLHGLDFVTPSLVALAARKIYTHRIVITKPERERSLQWGSSVEAVKELLDGLTVDDIIEEVLEAVETPL